MAAGDVVITRNVPLPGGYLLLGGTVTLDGGNPTPIALANYLSAVDFGIVSLEGSVAPGADPVQVTSQPSTTTLNVYAWKPTTAGAGGNADLIASADNARLVSWLAIGPIVPRQTV